MPGQRRVGMDHEHYDWSPLSRRGVLRWPERARVAVGVLVTLEHTEWRPPEGSVQAVTSVGGLAARHFPDYSRLSHREYGHRVGIFRLLDVLEKHGLQATVAMDALTAEHYPYLVRHCLERVCEIIGHGISASQLSSTMSEAAERDSIRTAMETLTRATGQPPVGWFGPDYGESARTPPCLAQAGMRDVCDWAHDEHPSRRQTTQGAIWALPLLLDLDDLHAMGERHMPVTREATLLTDSVEPRDRDGGHNGRRFMRHLPPCLSGHPFRSRSLDAALRTIMRRQGVWAASGRTIIDWYRRHPAVASSWCPLPRS